MSYHSSAAFLPNSWLAEAAFHAPYPWIAATTVIWFALIYSVVAGGAYRYAVRKPESEPQPTEGRAQRMRPQQLREELLGSSVSIAIFAAQAVGLVWALRAGWLQLAHDRSLWHLLWELPVLYLWNELHFFAVHRLLHWPALYRTIHIRHHRSVLTTPFSAYSFHPVESFLLGSVLPLALLLHAFSPVALLGLTVMSLLLNVAGHIPHERIRPWFAFAVAHARYHNQHHRKFHEHFAFSLAPLDKWFTRVRSDTRANLPD